MNHDSAPVFIKEHLAKIKLPHPDSHKGQNGKLLIIGGSELFHAASKWSLDVASKFVDMVFYSSVPSNNQLVHEAKREFWNGIIIPREEIENYISEADCILIGPGMTRTEFSSQIPTALTPEEWDHDTQKVVNFLLSKYGRKKWVLDAGALQMVNPELLTGRCIVTPHLGELQRLLEHVDSPITQQDLLSSKQFETLRNKGVTFLIKGPVDTVIQNEQVVEIAGGNAGMTKGGTGDTLAGLVAGLYCTNDALTTAVVASYSNKKAGDHLYQTVGPFFNASDLVTAVPTVMWQHISK